jgi:cytochrome P450
MVTVFIYVLPILVIAIHIRNYFLLPRTLPGPFLARFTNLHRLFSVLFSSPHEDQVKLHEKYGPIIRLGPNMVSLQSPVYTPQIYGIGKGLTKSDYYSVFQNIVNGKRTASLVAMTDESQHARTKRLIANAYSLTTLVEFEPLVDSTIQVFLDILSTRFASTRQICDLGLYLQYFAFDVIGELTFSRRLGFLETGTDVNGILAAISSNFRYFSVIGQMPWLDEVLGKNPVYVRYFRKPVSSPILSYAQTLLHERLEALDNDSTTTSDRTHTDTPPDFLTRFLATRTTAAADEVDLTTDAQLLSYLFANINAGSDTIASTLRALFHHTLSDRAILRHVLDELHTAKLTKPVPTHADTQALPYLQAVIKETLRINPALSLVLERVVPAEGLILQHDDDDKAGSPPRSNVSHHSPTPTMLPPGTIIGINPYVQHRHAPTFSLSPSSPGKDYPVNEFHPSRWVASQETTKSMDRALLTFGAGKRSCLGKNVALLEIGKVVAALLLAFGDRLERVGGEKGGDLQGEWEVNNKWVLEQKGLRVRFADGKA